MVLVGAGDAIGAAVARRFAQGGYDVCIAAAMPQSRKRLVDELQPPKGTKSTHSASMRAGNEVQDLFASVEARSDHRSLAVQCRLQRQQAAARDHRKLFFKAWELACYAGSWSAARPRAS